VTAATSPPIPAKSIDTDAWTQRTALLLLTAAMGLFIIAPLGVMAVRSVTNDDSTFVGLLNFINYFSDRTLRQSLVNTLILGFVSMVVAVALAFPYAYAVTCSRAPLRRLFLVLAMIPLYAPTMLYGIGLYTLFGNQGLLTTGIFGRIPLHVSLYIHGLTGIILSEVMASFPPAVLILVVSLSHRDRRLYDAAASMGAGAWRTFTSITLPGCRFALISAASIAFVLSTTDYGAPEMLAEKTNVLALDIAIKAMGIGQKSDHAMGAVISLVLLIPTVIASAIEMLMRKKQSASLTARSVAMVAGREPLRDWILFFYCALLSGLLLVVTAAPVMISFVTSWPYSLYPKTGITHFKGTAFTLDHFNFDLIGQATGGGLAAYWNSLMVAGLTAILGTAISFIAAYLIEKTSVFRGLRKCARAMAMIPLGLPGMVLGLAFVLIFAPAKWGPVPNPMAGIYGTFTIIIACNIVHYLGVSFLTASTAVTQLDAEFEQVAASMNVSTWRLFLRVTVPICTPAILEIGMYYFVSAMTTVSAVIFLVSVRTPLASVAIVNLKDTGNLEAAAAMSVMILASNVIVRVAVEPSQRFFRNRTQRWRGEN
jgi:iron(III) transport system permease protein